MIRGEIILDSRYKTKNGYPLRLRLYDGKVHRHIHLKMYQQKPKLERTQEVKRKEFEIEENLEFINKNGLDINSAMELIGSGKMSRELEIMLLQKRLSELQGESGIGLLEFIDIRVKEKRQVGESVRSYLQLKRVVKDYLFLRNDVPINEINYEWLIGFINSKRATGAKRGVNTYLRGIRAVYKEAQRRESLGIKRDNPFLGLINVSGKKEVPDIKFEDFKKMMVYEPPKSTTERNFEIIKRNIRLFMFQIAIGGHDYADVANLKWSNIKNGRIKFKRFKNRNKPNGGEVVDNMLSEFALSVIENYGTKNNQRVFSFIPDPNQEKVYAEYRNRVNRSLKKVCENLGIEFVTSKTPRYLFRTYAGELLIDTIAIMQIQGHSPQGVSFNYQRALPYEVIDCEHQKVLQLVFDDLKG